jgi:hypothetical protein
LDLVALEIAKPMAGIQELSDFAVMAFAHGPSAIAGWLFLALVEHARGRTGAAEVAAGREATLRPRLKSDDVSNQAEVELLAAEVDAAVPPRGK